MSDLFKNRAASKARARERDEERLRRGEITPSQLQQENLIFRGFRRSTKQLNWWPRPRMNSHKHMSNYWMAAVFPVHERRLNRRRRQGCFYRLLM